MTKFIAAQVLAFVLALPVHSEWFMQVEQDPFTDISTYSVQNSSPERSSFGGKTVLFVACSSAGTSPVLGLVPGRTIPALAAAYGMPGALRVDALKASSFEWTRVDSKTMGVPLTTRTQKLMSSGGKVLVGVGQPGALHTALFGLEGFGGRLEELRALCGLSPLEGEGS